MMRRPLHLLLLTLLAVANAGCRDGAGDTASRKPAAEREVAVATAMQREIERSITVFGSFLAREQVVISTKVPGRLAQVNVDIGSAVEAGAELASIESREYELRIRQSEAALAQARARLGLAADDETTVVNPEETSVVRQAAAVLQEATGNRDRLARLFQEGVLSQAELDSARASFTIAENQFQDALEDVRQRLALVSQRQAERDIAVQQLAETRLKAPFKAVVQERLTSPGEYLGVGSPVLTLVAVDPLRLRLEVSERDAHRVQLGQQVRVSVEGLDRSFTGTINRVSPAIHQQRRVLLVEADIANDGALHPGMFARADVVVKPRDLALTVPTNALVTFAGIEKVFTMAEGVAAERVVTSGQHTGGMVEILGNLKAGEQVILNPGKLQNGQPVRVGPAVNSTES